MDGIDDIKGFLAVALVFVVPMTAYFLSLSKNSILRTVGRLIFLTVILGFGAAALFFFGAPFFAPPRSGAFIMWVPGFICAFIAWVGFSFWSSLGEARRVMALPKGEQEEYTRDMIDRLIPEQEEIIRVKSEEVTGFWISPRRRARLRSDISQAEFMLKYLRVIRAKLEAGASGTEAKDDKPAPGLHPSLINGARDS